MKSFSFLKKSVQAMVITAMATSVFTGCSPEAINAVNAAVIEVANTTQENAVKSKPRGLETSAAATESQKATEKDPMMDKGQMAPEYISAQGNDENYAKTEEDYADSDDYYEEYLEAYEQLLDAYEGESSSDSSDYQTGYYPDYNNSYYGNNSYNDYYYGAQNNYYSNGYTNSYSGSDGNFGYVMVDGASVTYGD